jgi:hypothetical protein
MTTEQYLSELIAAKNDMKEALREKGVEVWGGLNTYPDAIDRIPAVELSAILKCEDGIRLHTGGEMPQLDISALTSMDSMFSGNALIPTGPFTSFGLDNLYNVTSMDSTFRNCSNLEYVEIPNATKVMNITECFAHDTALETVELGLPSRISSSARAFEDCESLTSVDLGNLIVSDDTEAMFRNCKSLTYLPVTNIIGGGSDNMYEGCTSLVNVPYINIVTSDDWLKDTFKDCVNLKSIGVIDGKPHGFGSNWFTSSTDNSWISGCANLESIGVIDCSEVQDIRCIFGDSDWVAQDGVKVYTDMKPKLVNVGGFAGYGTRVGGYPSTFSVAFALVPNISRESLINIFESLSNVNPGNIPLLEIQLDKLRASDIKIATDKGWTISLI